MPLNSTLETLLSDLQDSLNKIERMDLTLETILGDEDVQDLIDRRMQKTIETCIDIATHLIAALHLSRQDKASSAFELLGKEKIISSSLAEKMVGASGLRNVIVHGYREIDYRLAYRDLEEKLADLRQFAKEIYQFLEKQK